MHERFGSMKYVIGLILFFLSNSIFGQLNYTITSDTIVYPPAIAISDYSTMEIENQTTSPIQVSIIRLENDVAPDWLSAICTSVECYPVSTDSVSLDIAQGTTEEVKFYFLMTNNTEDTARALFLVRNEQNVTNQFSHNFYGIDTNEVLSNQALEEIMEVNVAPNPFSSFTMVRFPEYLNNERLQILSVYGKVVKTAFVTGNSFKLYREELQDGVYFLRLESGKYPTLRLLIR